MSIHKGETIRLVAKFTDDAKISTDPTTPVRISVTDPDGELVVDNQVVSGSDGVYSYSFTPAKSGIYTYRYTSSDGAKEIKKFNVEADEIG